MQLSPLLFSAIESLTHGIEHYFLKYGCSNKFTLLHIDQAVELLLKAKIQSIKGLTIFTKNGRTKDFYDCLKLLQNNDVEISEKGVLDEIHTKRNLSQHLGDSFDDYTIGYYVKFVYYFFQDFMDVQFDLKLEKYINESIKLYVDQIVIEPTKVYEEQQKYINDLIESGQYAESVISSWNALEFLIKGYSDENIGKSIDDTIEAIKSKRKIDSEDLEELESIAVIKNSIFSTDEEIDLSQAREIQGKAIDLTRTKIVAIPVKAPEKISVEQLSESENGYPVRLIDDTYPVENEQELFYANLKLYKSDKSYVSSFDTILRLYKSRLELDLQEKEGLEFLTQSSIYYKLPCWYWAKDLESDEIVEIVSRNLDKWPFYSIYHLLEVLLFIPGSKSSELLREFSDDRRIMISSRADYITRTKQNLMDIKDYWGITDLKTLAHLNRIDPNQISLPRSFYLEIQKPTSEERTTVFELIKNENGFEILKECMDSDDENLKKLILDAVSRIKDEKSISFYMSYIDNAASYKEYRDVILTLDSAIYCPLFN